MGISKGLFVLLAGLLILGMANLSFAEIKAGSVEVNGYVGGFIGLDSVRWEEEEGDPCSYVDFQDGVIGGFRLGYNFTPYIGTELGWGWSSNNVKVKYEDEEEGVNASEFLFHSNLVVHLLPKGRFIPFLTGGVGLIHLRGAEVKSAYEEMDESRTRFAGNWGGGMKVFLKDNVAFRTDLRFFNVGLGGYSVDRANFLEISAGLTWFFGGK